MPQSKKRKPHLHAHDYIPHEKKKKSAVPVAIVFCMLVALGIGWFAAGPSVTALTVAAIVGAIIGYFAGKGMDQTFGNK